MQRMVIPDYCKPLLRFWEEFFEKNLNFFRKFSQTAQRQEQNRSNLLENGEKDRPQNDAVERGAGGDEEERCDLYPAQRRRHPKGKERCERKERKEQIQPAAQQPSGETAAHGAQKVEDQTQREPERRRARERQRLVRDRQTHPNSRAKKPSPFAGSSA